MKKRIEIIVIIISIFVSAFLSGCSKKTELISYDEYNKLFNDISKNFTPPNLTKTFSQDQLMLVAIDKENSFGKRQFLTLDGEQSHTPTQKKIIYESKELKCTILIDIIYLNKELDKDMVYWNSYPSQGYGDIVLSYRNLLINMTKFSEGEESGDILRRTSLKMVEYLNNYKFD